MQEQSKFESVYWVFTVLFGAIFIILWYCVLCFAFRHSYELSPGTLVSDRWSWDFWREWLLFLYWLLPLSGFFMLMSQSSTGTTAHLVVCVLLLGWWGVVFAFDLGALAGANLPMADPGFSPSNLAHDARYCCVYGGQLGAELYCHLNATLTPCLPISADQLTVNGPFMARFIVNIIVGAFIVFDLFTSLLQYRPFLKSMKSKRQRL